MLQFFEPHMLQRRKTVISVWYWSLVRYGERGVMAEQFAQSPMRQVVFKKTLTRLMGRPGFDRLRGLPLLDRIGARKRPPIPDPVSLAVLAIDRVGPATVRACASGVEVRVAAPDEATALVLRAALDQTARRRGTDRLIRIVVD
jgi:hypothetical protein